MSEKESLLTSEQRTSDTKSTKNYCGILTFIITFFIIIILVGGNLPLVILYARTDCQNSISYITAYSRSGSCSLLYAISNPDLICNEPLLDLSLNNKNSMVEIYQTLCQSIESQPFQVSYEFNNLPSNSGPRPIFDENFSPQNYFLDGTIQLEITNITTILSSANIDLCLFYDDYEYSRFLRVGMDWKNHMINSKCNIITAENGKNYSVSFNISKPTFVFLGMASVGSVQVDQLNITATGRQISNLGKNSTKVCQLNGEDTTCSFSTLNNELKSQNVSLCIIACEVENADGTFDYSNLTINFPNQVNHNNPYKMMLTVYGSTSLGIIVMSALLLIGITILRKRIHNRQNSPREYSVQSARAQVTHNSEEDTIKHHTGSKEQSLRSLYGSNQQQQSTYQQTY